MASMTQTGKSSKVKGYYDNLHEPSSYLNFGTGGKCQLEREKFMRVSFQALRLCDSINILINCILGARAGEKKLLN